MSHDHERFADWDAAYVIGALSPSDRRAFEEHLEGCERCARAVAEIAPTLGLLARVDPGRAESMLGERSDDAAGAGERSASSMLTRDALLARAAREGRMRRTRWVSMLAAAAVLVVALVVSMGGLLAPASSRGDVRAAELVAAGDLPLIASVELDPVGWGTRIELECSYQGSGGPAGGWTYVLVVVDRDGASSQISSWRAAPGSTARLSAATALDVADIAAVEIRAEGSGDVLMRAELDEG
ncbi:zf-HC2 domain-containing protein [Agrococcus sp. KRD186]|jgi:hypothetical protein|uniref:zf-HC2 domain-containing protein n=1 Tax=Agrococcus sp. KRD186 TaxID=2729730 RepID=UPI0019D07CA9|nr:zf-HC2 domain-containing protein [Agrococcus sp. KRD186]